MTLVGKLPQEVPAGIPSSPHKIGNDKKGPREPLFAEQLQGCSTGSCEAVVEGEHHALVFHPVAYNVGQG